MQNMPNFWICRIAEYAEYAKYAKHTHTQDFRTQINRLNMQNNMQICWNMQKNMLSNMHNMENMWINMQNMQISKQNMQINMQINLQNIHSLHFVCIICKLIGKLCNKTWICKIICKICKIIHLKPCVVMIS